MAPSSLTQLFCNQRQIPHDDTIRTNEEFEVTVNIPALVNDEISIKEITEPPTKGTATIIDDKIVYTPPNINT